MSSLKKANSERVCSNLAAFAKEPTSAFLRRVASMTSKSLLNFEKSARSLLTMKMAEVHS